VLTFTAAIGREQLISRRLQDVAEKLCGGSLTPLLMNLVRSRALTARELADLQDLVKELSRRARPPDRPR
jgi:predicted transcriptional regulator